MIKNFILVTGGAGYLGSHTIIELILKGYDVISIDNFSNSNSLVFDYIKKITDYNVLNLNIDLSLNNLDNIFHDVNILAVIHFAAFKSVPDSLSSPEKYYNNNIKSLLNILNFCIKRSISNFIFSSSCSVYGDITELPVNELSTVGEPKSPYAHTKLIGEKMLHFYANTYKLNAVSLRYFNPVGAHSSGLIGEFQHGVPDNLMPVITQTAVGLRSNFTVYGDCYDTRDGSCIRDYIHVSDISIAHVLAIDYLNGNLEKNNINSVINLGSGTGVSVFELINEFQNVNNIKVDFIIGQPRLGDVVKIYSDSTKAFEILKWSPIFNITDIVSSAWKWQLNLYNNKNSFQ